MAAASAARGVLEGDVVVGLGYARRFAGDRVAQHAKAVLGADDEGEEPVEVIEAVFQRLPEVATLLHAIGQIGGCDFGVVLGFDAHALALEHRASGVQAEAAP